MKKKILALLLATTFIMTTAGCAESANPAPSSEAPAGSQAVQSGSASQEAPAPEKNTLVVAYPSGGNTLNPTRATDSTSAVFVNAAYDQLVTYGSTTDDMGYELAVTSDIQPSLAKSWTTSEDGLEHVITLDENATFANGDKVDANAVIYSFNRIKNSNYTGFLYTLANIESMEAVDELTIKFTLSKPCTIFYNLLQMHIFSIVNPNELEGKTEEEIDEYLTTNTVGSGAYAIESWDATTESVLTAREDYWKGKAAIDEVVVQVVAEASNRVLFAKNGDADVSLYVPAKDLGAFDGVENVEVREYDSVSVVYMSYNTTKEPFNNPLVRQALNYAMPYDSLVTDIMAGRATKLDHIVPQIMPAHLESDENVYTQDLDMAKDLLTQAGYPDGFEVELTYSASSQEDEDTAILLESVLAPLGIKVTLDKLERPQYLAAIRAQDFDMALAGYTAFVNDPGYYFGNVYYSKGEYNYGKYASAEVDSIWETAEGINDLQARYDMYQDAQLVVAQDAGVAPLYEKSTIVVLGDTVSRYKHYPDGALRFAEMAL